MKKLYIQILTVVLFIATSLSSFGQIKRDTRGFQIVDDAEFSVFDTRGEISSGISPPCDCIGCCEIPNFRFTDPTLAALRNHEASQLAAAAEFYAWVNTQYNLMEQEIERQLGKDFSNFNEAQSAFFKSFEVSSVKTESKHLSPKYNSKVNVKQSVRALCLTEIKKLDLRANEINSGNINNSQYGNLRYKSTPLNEITSINQLNTFRAQEVNEFSDNQWRLDQELRIQNQLNNELSNLQNLNHDILNKLSDKQKAYFGQAGNDFDKLDHMQQYLVANVYVFQGPVLPPWDKVYSFGSRDYIESYVWEKNPAHLSIFHSDYWQSIVIYPTGPVVAQLEVERLRQEALAQALNEVSTADILADGAIAGLGSRNEDFIKAKPELHNEVNKYFKVNDFSKASSDCVNYLLNQYHNGGDFAANTNLYKSANTPLYQNAQNTNRALEWKPGTQAVAEGFTNFGNVLSSLFENYPNPAYEGYIIRDMFGVNDIGIPNNIIDPLLGSYYSFALTDGNTVKIDFEAGLGEYLFDLGVYNNEFLATLNINEASLFLNHLKSFQNTSLKFSSLWDNYEDIKGTHIINEDKDDFSNYCAINLSHALVSTGVPLNKFKGVKCWGCQIVKNNGSHAIRAQELADWLKNNSTTISGMKNPVFLKGNNFEDSIDGKKGIVFFRDYWQRDSDTGDNRTGDHIDLWDGNELAGSSWFWTRFRLNLPWIAERLGSSDLVKSKEVIFWEIND